MDKSRIQDCLNTIQNLEENHIQDERLRDAYHDLYEAYMACGMKKKAEAALNRSCELYVSCMLPEKRRILDIKMQWALKRDRLEIVNALLDMKDVSRENAGYWLDLSIGVIHGYSLGKNYEDVFELFAAAMEVAVKYGIQTNVSEFLLYTLGSLKGDLREKFVHCALEKGGLQLGEDVCAVMAKFTQ